MNARHSAPDGAGQHGAWRAETVGLAVGSVLAIAINFATDDPSNPWLWVLVVALTALAISVPVVRRFGWAPVARVMMSLWVLGVITTFVVAVVRFAVYEEAAPIVPPPPISSNPPVASPTEPSDPVVECGPDADQPVRLSGIRSTDGAAGIATSYSIRVDVGRAPPPGRSYWVIADFVPRGDPEVYKVVLGPLVAPGTSRLTRPIGGAVGTVRTHYVVEAADADAPILADNLAHDEATYDQNRTRLPTSAVPVSNYCRVPRSR